VTAVTPDLIFQVANGFMAAKHLFVANEVGLFEALGEAPAMLDDLWRTVPASRVAHSASSRMPWSRWASWSGRETSTRTPRSRRPF
jgi:hypothetical protein